MGDVRLTHGVKWQRQLAKAARHAGDALGHELGYCARVGAGLLLRAHGPAERRCEGLGRSVGLVGIGRVGRACEAFFFFSSFFFFISSPLFDFKFGLEFEFKTEVTYSLEFREFCLIITLWFITLMELLSIT